MVHLCTLWTARSSWLAQSATPVFTGISSTLRRPTQYSAPLLCSSYTVLKQVDSRFIVDLQGQTMTRLQQPIRSWRITFSEKMVCVSANHDLCE